MTSVNPALPDIVLTGHGIEHRDNEGASRAQLSYWTMCSYGSAFRSGLFYVMVHAGVTRSYFDTYFGDSIAHGCGAGRYPLTAPAREITIGAILRAAEGPLAEVRGLRPHEETTYGGAAQHPPEVWVSTRASLRQVLDETTLTS